MRKFYIKTISIVCFCFFIHKSYGQESPTETNSSPKVFTLSPFTNLIIGKELGKVYSLGFGVNAGVKLNIYSNKAFVQPNVSYEYYGININKGTRNNLGIIRYGFQVKYQFQITGDKYYYPILDLNYAHIQNTLSARSGFKGEPIDLSDGNGLSTGLGVGLTSGRINLSFIYNYFKPKINAGDEVVDEINEESSIYDPYILHPTSMDFSNIQLSIGFQIN